jgi:hypothetical protein
MEKKYPIGGYAPGNYWNKCGTCNVEFIGDKRAYQCEPCGTKSQAEYDALTEEEKEERIKRNVEVYNQFIKEVRDPTINKPHPAVAHRFPEPILSVDVKDRELKMAPNPDELWDEFSEEIPDDIDSLTRWAGSVVMSKEGFKRMMERLKGIR